MEHYSVSSSSNVDQTSRKPKPRIPSCTDCRKAGLKCSICDGGPTPCVRCEDKGLPCSGPVPTIAKLKKIEELGGGGRGTGVVQRAGGVSAAKAAPHPRPATVPTFSARNHEIEQRVPVAYAGIQADRTNCRNTRPASTPSYTSSESFQISTTGPINATFTDNDPLYQAENSSSLFDFGALGMADYYTQPFASGTAAEVEDIFSINPPADPNYAISNATIPSHQTEATSSASVPNSKRNVGTRLPRAVKETQKPTTAPVSPASSPALQASGPGPVKHRHATPRLHPYQSTSSSKRSSPRLEPLTLGGADVRSLTNPGFANRETPADPPLFVYGDQHQQLFNSNEVFVVADCYPQPVASRSTAMVSDTRFSISPPVVHSYTDAQTSYHQTEATSSVPNCNKRNVGPRLPLAVKNTFKLPSARVSSATPAVLQAYGPGADRHRPISPRLHPYQSTPSPKRGSPRLALPNLCEVDTGSLTDMGVANGETRADLAYVNRGDQHQQQLFNSNDIFGYGPDFIASQSQYMDTCGNQATTNFSLDVAFTQVANAADYSSSNGTYVPQPDFGIKQPSRLAFQNTIPYDTKVNATNTSQKSVTPSSVYIFDDTPRKDGKVLCCAVISESNLNLQNSDSLSTRIQLGPSTKVAHMNYDEMQLFLRGIGPPRY